MSDQSKQTAAQFAFHCLLDVFAPNWFGMHNLVFHCVRIVAQPSSAHSLSSVRWLIAAGSFS
ncbi:hypothetical protein FC652_19080 [Vibrio sp. 05-20-BW147]|nr:hypothetical protein [Vibrio sp. 05-20-BW147]